MGEETEEWDEYKTCPRSQLVNRRVSALASILLPAYLASCNQGYTMGRNIMQILKIMLKLTFY